MLTMLHLADLHLGWKPRDWPADKAAQRQRRRDRVLERAVDVALERNVHLVVIAGDLFETYQPDDAVLHAAVAQLERLTAAGVAVVTLPGNHDEITYPTCAYRVHADRWPGHLVTNPRPERLGPIPTRGGDVWLYTLAYVGGITPARSPLREFPARDGKGVHLALFHGTLGAGLGERSLPLDPSALGAMGYDYIALGHIHKPGTQRLGGTPAVYPGCIEGKGFDDPGVPAWTFARFADGSATVEQVDTEIQPVRTVQIDLTQIDDAEALRERIRAEADPDAIQRVRLTGSLHLPDVDPAALQAEHAPRFHWLEVRDDSRTVSPALIDRWAGEPTVRGAFVQRMRARIEGADDEDARERLVRALRYGVNALQAEGR